MTETDTGGELTIDHFIPLIMGGGDLLENLIYCCIRCNWFKRDYFPSTPQSLALWNPRIEPASLHFLELDDCTLHPLTPVGAFSIERLRLNRSQLVAYRRQRNQRQVEGEVIKQQSELISSMMHTNRQDAILKRKYLRQLLNYQQLVRALLGTNG